MREVKTKGKKGTKGVSAQRYGDDLTKKTPRQTTPAIPETEVAQQMANEINPEVAGPRYTVTPYPADEGVASIRHQTSTSNGPALSWFDSFTDKEFDVLDKILNDDPLLPDELSDIPNITPKQLESILSVYDELRPYIPQKIEKFKQLQSKANGTFRYTEGPHVTPNKEKINSAVTPTPNRYKNALTGAGALTGLGVATYPFLSGEENENISEVPVFSEAPQAQTEPTLEQQYASRVIPETDSGIWGEKINKLTHPTLKDFLPNSSIVPLSPLNREAFHQPLAVSSNFNGLVRNRYKRASDAPSELPANTSRDTFIAPRELPAKGQTLADYNKSNSPQDVTSGPRVLNAPVEKKAVTTKPVQPENRLTEANLASAMAREAASPQVLQYGSPAYLQKNKPVDMRQWVRQKYGMSMSPAEMVQRGIMPYEYLQYW